MIPGMVGKNIRHWIEIKNLPKTVSQLGNRPEEIFVHYEELTEKYGKRMKDIPLGAVALYCFTEKIDVGLQQLMTGNRNLSLPSIFRKDVMSLTEEAAQISGISYIMEGYREEAETILDS